MSNQKAIEELILRKAAFDLYPSLYNINNYHKFSSGRVLLGHYENWTGKIDKKLFDFVDSEDIVFIPLHSGIPMRDRMWCDTWDSACEYRKENEDIIKELAPRVKGILVGNMGPECTMTYLWLKQQWKPRKIMSLAMRDYTLRAVDFIGNCGGKVFGGLYDWDLAIDYYYGNGILQKTCNELDVTQIIFCGYQLAGYASDTAGCPRIPYASHREFWCACPNDEEPPRKNLSNFIKNGNYWSGCNGLDGLRHGMDSRLKEFGFKSGVVGF